MEEERGRQDSPAASPTGREEQSSAHLVDCAAAGSNTTRAQWKWWTGVRAMSLAFFLGKAMSQAYCETQARLASSPPASGPAQLFSFTWEQFRKTSMDQYEPVLEAFMWFFLFAFGVLSLVVFFVFLFLFFSFKKYILTFSNYMLNIFHTR